MGSVIDVDKNALNDISFKMILKNCIPLEENTPPTFHVIANPVITE